ncbi:hypothetical protein NDU88_005029 [Pleurodeles waltl]|uniref:Uncharacterized protein n=1 Tax=Pleurodeles waltl TaxID=8319 RepID=A0AAV7RMX8_PLEWA|nr:hypothetical protein NDU88_005029 [Pleurodeles waltl]
MQHGAHLLGLSTATNFILRVGLQCESKKSARQFRSARIAEVSISLGPGGTVQSPSEPVRARQWTEGSACSGARSQKETSLRSRISNLTCFQAARGKRTRPGSTNNASSRRSA